MDYQTKMQGLSYNIPIYAMNQTYQLRNRKWDRPGFAVVVDETAVHGCHCRCDTVERMRKIIATYICIPQSWYACLSAVIGAVF